VLPGDLQILEVSRVPERVEVALDGCRIVDISLMAEQPRQHRLSGNAAVADHPDLLDHVLRRGGGSRWSGGALLCPGIQTGTAKEKQAHNPAHPEKEPRRLVLMKPGAKAP